MTNCYSSTRLTNKNRKLKRRIRRHKKKITKMKGKLDSINSSTPLVLRMPVSSYRAEDLGQVEDIRNRRKAAIVKFLKETDSDKKAKLAAHLSELESLRSEARALKIVGDLNYATELPLYLSSHGSAVRSEVLTFETATRLVVASVQANQQTGIVTISPELLNYTDGNKRIYFGTDTMTDPIFDVVTWGNAIQMGYSSADGPPTDPYAFGAGRQMAGWEGSLPNDGTFPRLELIPVQLGLDMAFVGSKFTTGEAFNIQNWDTGYIQNFTGMFMGSDLVQGVSDLDMGNAIAVGWMFYMATNFNNRGQDLRWIWADGSDKPPVYVIYEDFATGNSILLQGQLSTHGVSWLPPWDINEVY